MGKFDRTDSAYIEQKIDDALMQLQIGEVVQVYTHDQPDDTSNYEANVILRDEEKERRKVPIMTAKRGQIFVPDVGDKVVVGFLDSETESPIILGNIYDIENRAPVNPPREVPLSISHTRWADGLSDEEIHRMVLSSGEKLFVEHLETRFKGGGTDANFSVDVYDASDGTVLAETSSKVSGNPVGKSTDGATVLVRITNQTGTGQDASVQGSLTIKEV